MNGAVSRTLEAEVREKVRSRGVVVWLDAASAYSGFVDALAARTGDEAFPFPIVGFRGSFLELMFALEPFGSSTESQPILVHLPGFNTETVEATPVLELFRAGTMFQKSLETLVREAAHSRVAPAAVDAFVAQAPSLAQADTWLEAAASGAGAVGLAAMLREVGATLVAEALVSPGGALEKQIASEVDQAVLASYLHAHTGLDDAWRAMLHIDRPLEALPSWILSVEYVHDLRRAPKLPALARLKDLSPTLVSACVALVDRLRHGNPTLYQKCADETEAQLADELEGIAPDDLGSIDTFRAEGNRVLSGAVEALRKGDWAQARRWHEERNEGRSFWLQHDQSHRLAWAIVAEAASFGEAIARHPAPFARLTTLDAAADAYAAGAAEVDRAHRRFEQRRGALFDRSLPHYGALAEVTTDLRRRHRAWADDLARAFAAICKDGGFLPSASYQQRTLYEQVVTPLVGPGGKERVCVFLIDAFRFEMATELLEELAGPGRVVDLKPRLAELPTITAVGMNVLAPVAKDGRLDVVTGFKGFRTMGVTVTSPGTRAQAMGSRSTGRPALRLKLAEVADPGATNLSRTLRDHSLVVVHSKEIDDAGEANVGILAFDAILAQIRAAWHHLQLAGVKHFVFTADHGFLLQDETTAADEALLQKFGSKRDPERRYVLDELPRSESGMVPVSVGALGYDGITGYLLFREDTKVFDTGVRGATFVHGGNSPQERIIPVLTVTTEKKEQASTGSYALEAEAADDLLGFRVLRVRLSFELKTTTSLGYAAPPNIEVAVKVPGRDDLRVVLKDADPSAVLDGGRLRLPISTTWTKLFFRIEGARAEKVRLEVFHPNSIERVASASPEALFAVDEVTTAKSVSAPPPPEVVPLSWSDAISDPGARRIFLHIKEHGAITEAEIVAMLGTPRLFRRFSLEFEALAEKVPFRVRIESGENGKRYVREGDR